MHAYIQVNLSRCTPEDGRRVFATNDPDEKKQSMLMQAYYEADSEEKQKRTYKTRHKREHKRRQEKNEKSAKREEARHRQHLQ